ncbi:MAG: glycerate kinase [Candidatus Dormibacteria bacterium]
MPESQPAASPIAVLVAPNTFKGWIPAALAAPAIAGGVREAWPSAVCREMPLADGGDGFLDALAALPGSRVDQHQVHGPLGQPVSARLVRLGRGRVAAVELAGACGLGLVAQPRPETSLRASTRAVGELILEAIHQEARQVVVGLGGSASTDGGAGLVQALGFRLTGGDGEELAPGGVGLLELAGIDPGRAAPGLRELDLVAACDVDSPLLGPYGAARVFGPQKGAGPAEVEQLERGLANWAEVLRRELGPVPSPDRPGMGAAGGTAYGLAALCGARLESGVSLVADLVGLDGALDRSQLVITGEGRFDRTSLSGKVTGEVLRRAAARGLPCIVLSAGWEEAAARRARELGGVLVLTTSAPGRLPRSRAEALGQLRAASRQACLELGPLGRGGPGQSVGGR